MGKNKLHQSFLLCIIVITGLFILSDLPQFSLGSIAFRKMNPLSDIHYQTPDSLSLFSRTVAQIDSTETPRQEELTDKIVQTKTYHRGFTLIEDYSGDSTALGYFFKALGNTNESRSTRIAFYGDSFIEGDVFCGSFRDSLQSIFGGRGVGFVPITSDVTGFRNTIKHDFDHWETHSVIHKKDSTVEYGPSGFCFLPQEGNWVEFRGSKQRFLKDFNTVKLYYKTYKSATVRYTINKDTAAEGTILQPSAHLQEVVVNKNNIQSIRIKFEPFDSLYLYGASMENGGGVYVDNFSLRGNSGISLLGIPDAMLKKFNGYRQYKLVILQFGLNMVVEESLDYNAYVKRMVKVISKLKKCFPRASFLLIGVSDRSSNLSGEYRTMAAIPAMRNAQREIARQTRIAFWDLFEAMGGENSMVKFVQSSPALAARDYTHLNFNGGKKMAGSLMKSLLHEHKKYDARKK